MDEPEWMNASRSFLAFMLEEGEASTADLRAHLERLLAAGADVASPDTDEEAPERDFTPMYQRWSERAWQRFPNIAGLDHEPTGRWLADDLGDIGTELEWVVRNWDAGLRGAAQWEFQFGWWTHWGAEHARPLLDWLRANAHELK